MDEIMTTDINSQSTSKDIDQIFNNLNQNIDSVNKFISNLNTRKKENDEVVGEIEEARKKLDQEKKQYESNMKIQLQELEAKKAQLEKYFMAQKQALSGAEEEFKRNMDIALSEFDIKKKESQLEKEKIDDERTQFENYKKIELDRIQHLEEVLSSEKIQFEKYKEVTNKKIELENMNLEQKCEKLKEIVSQFNVNLKPLNDIKE